MNELTKGDYTQSGFTITVVTGVPHGLVTGVPVRLDFLGSTGGPPPADGTFTASVIDGFSFTVTHGTNNTCGTALAPCGKVELVRTIQPADLNYSLTCVPSYQGVLQMADVSAGAPTITPTVDDTGLFWNSTVIVREGGPCGASQVGAGTTYTRIWRSAVDSRQDYLVLARLNDPLVPGVEDALVKVDVSASCPPTLESEKVLVREGNTILNTGGCTFTGFYSLQKRSFALNDRGDFMYIPTMEDDGFPSIEHPIVLNNRAVLSEFNQVPGPNASGTMVQFQLATIDLNDLGDYVAQVRVQESPHPIDCDPGPLVVYCTPYGEAIVQGSADVGSPKKFIQTGDDFPDSTITGMGNEDILRIGARREIQSESPRMVFPVFITNGGDVIWYGEWGHLENGFEVTVGRGIFFNKKLIAQVGDALSGPADLLLEFGVADTEVRSAMEVSPNGRYLLFYGMRGSASSPTISLFRIDLGESATYGTVAQAAGVAGCPASSTPEDADSGTPRCAPRPAWLPRGRSTAACTRGSRGRGSRTGRPRPASPGPGASSPAPACARARRRGPRFRGAPARGPSGACTRPLSSAPGGRRRPRLLLWSELRAASPGGRPSRTR